MISDQIPRVHLVARPNPPIRRRLQSNSNERPVMHTFYHEFNAAAAGTGMTTAADQALLKVWVDEWTSAGWNPKILNMEDVRQHPQFESINAMLNGLPFKYYDRLCFLRWLAIAQVGGGWIVDYDAFPLAFVTNELPNQGRMTIHEYAPTGGVPAMVSANEAEFNRFAWALVENAQLHKHEDHWSDMKALQDIYQQTLGQTYVMTKLVLPGLAVLSGKGYTDEICERAKDAAVIHFSHNAIANGVTPPGTGPGDRSSIARDWLTGWRSSCKVLSNLPVVEIEPHIRKIDNADPPQLQRATLVDPMSPKGSKPIIYSFFEEADVDHTGMSQDDNEKMIQAWATTWIELGWEPRVLTISVASQHPQFVAFDKMLTGLPFRTFDKLCFYRWISMAVVQGGWMSDYDTFPLERVRWNQNGDPHFIPNNGDLTVHELSKMGGVPSLVSGRGDEWFRLAKAQVENAQDHKSVVHWSDMKAMQDLYQQSGGKFYKMEENVVMASILLDGKTLDLHLCLWLKSKYAVHFSRHSMLQTGRYKDGHDGARQRPEVARKWINEYRQKCQPVNSEK